MSVFHFASISKISSKIDFFKILIHYFSVKQTPSPCTWLSSTKRQNHIDQQTQPNFKQRNLLNCFYQLLNACFVIVITFYSATSLGQETAKTYFVFESSHCLSTTQGGASHYPFNCLTSSRKAVKTLLFL